jgi:hypothetical protein
VQIDISVRKLGHPQIELAVGIGEKFEGPELVSAGSSSLQLKRLLFFGEDVVSEAVYDFVGLFSLGFDEPELPLIVGVDWTHFDSPALFG